MHFSSEILKSQSVQYELKLMQDVRNLMMNRRKYCQLRARRALTLFNDVPLGTRRVLSLYKVYENSTLLLLTGTYSIYAALMPFWFSNDNNFVHVEKCLDKDLVFEA